MFRDNINQYFHIMNHNVNYFFKIHNHRQKFIRTHCAYYLEHLRRLFFFLPSLDEINQTNLEFTVFDVGSEVIDELCAFSGGGLFWRNVCLKQLVGGAPLQC